MSDNKTPSKEEQAAVKLNEDSVEKLAEITQSIAEEKVKELYGADLGEALSNARQAIAAKAELAQATATPAAAPQKMNEDQMAEWMACALTGRAPVKQLDEGGIVTQALGGLQTQALGPATPNKGGYLVPEDFRAEIVRKADEPAVVWPLVRKMSTSRDSVVKPSIVTYIDANQGTDAKSSSTTSTDLITETEPVYDELTWTMRYMDARFFAKIDLLEDSPIDVMGDLMWQVSDSFATKHENLVLNGTGSGDSLPQGIMTDTGITSVAFGGAPTVARVLDFVRQLPQRYRSRATALMDGEIMYSIAEELATEVRSAQFLMDKLPPMLESERMPANKILVGDFQRYEVFYNRLMYMMSSESPKNFSMEVAVVEKWDGQATLKEAFLIGTGVTPGS